VLRSRREIVFIFCT